MEISGWLCMITSHQLDTIWKLKLWNGVIADSELNDLRLLRCSTPGLQPIGFLCAILFSNPRSLLRVWDHIYEQRIIFCVTIKVAGSNRGPPQIGLDIDLVPAIVLPSDFKPTFARKWEANSKLSKVCFSIFMSLIGLTTYCKNSKFNTVLSGSKFTKLTQCQRCAYWRGISPAQNWSLGWRERTLICRSHILCTNKKLLKVTVSVQRIEHLRR